MNTKVTPSGEEILAQASGSSTITSGTASAANSIIVGERDETEVRVKQIFEELGVGNSFEEVLVGLRKNYDEEDRRYHNWSHIKACLGHLYKLKDSLSSEDFRALVFAFLFHDVIYIASAKKGENEAQSALYGEEVMRKLGFDEAFIAKVSMLINLTSDHIVDKENTLGQIMIDIDLSILGQSWDIYEEYAHAIRYEYRMYTDEQYRAGRSDFLNIWLKKAIFQTPHFISEFEDQAKTNMTRELELLKTGRI